MNISPILTKFSLEGDLLVFFFFLLKIWSKTRFSAKYALKKFGFAPVSKLLSCYCVEKKVVHLFAVAFCSLCSQITLRICFSSCATLRVDWLHLLHLPRVYVMNVQQPCEAWLLRDCYADDILSLRHSISLEFIKKYRRATPSDVAPSSERFTLFKTETAKPTLRFYYIFFTLFI